jgi:hypothetical protein
MMPYTETVAFVELVTQVAQRLEGAVTEAAKLTALRERIRLCPDHVKKLANLRYQVKARATDLKKIHALDLSDWDLLRILIEAEGTTWTPLETCMWIEPKAANEGSGEKALKLRLGLSPVSTYKAGDLAWSFHGIRYLGEVKKLEGMRTGKPYVQGIQTGTAAENVYKDWLTFFGQDMLKPFEPDLRRVVGRGNLTAKRLRLLPLNVTGSLLMELGPLLVLGGYDVVLGTTRHGFITVPRHDYDVAWKLDRVSRSGPNYKLQTSYIVSRLKATLSTNHQADM